VTSSVDVTNRALQAIGTRSTIASMSEGSNESNNASLCYATTRQELIRSAPWNFATATATLALLKSAPGTVETPSFPAAGVWSTAYPPPGWSYEYAYPADCLRARKVVGNYMPVQTGSVPLFPFANTSPLPFWELPGQRFQVTTDLDVNNNPMSCILANIDQAILCYLRDIAIEDIWDPLFTDAMVQALAGKLALALTGDKQLAEQRFKMANEAVIEARAADANEGLTVMNHEAEWITAGHGIRWLGPGQSGTGFSMPFGSLFGGF
jgi:hypothetical protein